MSVNISRSHDWTGFNARPGQSTRHTSGRKRCRDWFELPLATGTPLIGTNNVHTVMHVGTSFRSFTGLDGRYGWTSSPSDTITPRLLICFDRSWRSTRYGDE